MWGSKGARSGSRDAALPHHQREVTGGWGIPVVGGEGAACDMREDTAARAVQEYRKGVALVGGEPVNGAGAQGAVKVGDAVHREAVILGNGREATKLYIEGTAGSLAVITRNSHQAGR